MENGRVSNEQPKDYYWKVYKPSIRYDLILLRQSLRVNFWIESLGTSDMRKTARNYHE